MNNGFVLIATDDDISAKSLEQAVRSFGCQVVTIPREQVTSTVISRFQPSLLILDLDRQDSSIRAPLSWQEDLCVNRAYSVLALSTRPKQTFSLSENLEYLQKPVDIEQVRLRLVRLNNARNDTPGPEAQNAAPDGLNEIRAFLLNMLGLDFSQDRQKKLERILNKRMNALGIDNIADYHKQLASVSSVNSELTCLIDNLTVGETSFFRYEAHDKALVETVLPDIVQRNQMRKSLKIWSAGCATGEEAYSLALLIGTHFPQLAEWNVRILATDINHGFLTQAAIGLFSEHSMRSVPQDMRDNCFTLSFGKYLLSEDIRRRVTFRHLNLHSGIFPVESEDPDCFDIILCRNVLIYFDAETRKATLNKLISNLRPDGYMFFGHTEMMQNISNQLRPVRYDKGYYYRLHN